VVSFLVRCLDQDELQQEVFFLKESERSRRQRSNQFDVSCLFQKNQPIPINIIACFTDALNTSNDWQVLGITYLVVVLQFCQTKPCVAAYCTLHRRHLVAQALSESLHDSLNVAIKTKNKTKTNALTGRLFRKLCEK